MSSRMHRAVSHLLPKIYQHPFNQALYQGTLSRDIFRCYVEQDALYLADFANALRVVSSRFNNSQYAQKFNVIAKEIIDTERNLHFKYLGEPRAPRLFSHQRKVKEKIPAVSAYTGYLLATVTHRSLEEAVACLVPCFAIYNQLGDKMRVQGDHPYSNWIRSYSNEQFTAATKSMIQIVNEMGETVSCPGQQNKMISAYVTSTQHEIAFWDSVYPNIGQQNELPFAVKIR